MLLGPQLGSVPMVAATKAHKKSRELNGEHLVFGTEMGFLECRSKES